MNLRKVAAQATIAGALGFTALGLGVGAGAASADNGSDEPQFDQVQYEEPPVYVPRPDFDAPPVYYPPQENEAPAPFFCFPFVICGRD